MERDQRRKEGLLNDIAESLGCVYLSSLHEVRWQAVLFMAVKKIKAEEYSVGEWNEAIHYILGETRGFVSAKEACDHLIRFSEDICMRGCGK